MKTLLILLALCLTLAGCNTCQTPPPDIVYKNVIVTPPDNLLLDCKTQEPPDRDAYAALDSWDKKEEVLTDNISKHLDNVRDCNTQMKGLRDWKENQKKLQESTAPPSK